MAQLITIRNANRTPLRIGSVNIPRDGASVTVDLDDGRVRRDLYRHVGRWIVVADAADTIAANAAITNLGAFTDPPSAGEMSTLRTKFNALLQAARDHGIIAP